MKRNWIALLIAAMALNLAACKKREKPIDPESARIIDEAVRRELNKPEGEITDEDTERIATLTLTGTMITDLRTVNRFKQLRNLNLLDCPDLTDLAPLA